MMANVRTIRNVIIILALAAIVAVVPGGGTGSSVLLQAIWLAFLAAFVWVATIMYREHRSELYALGDRKRAALYVAVAVLAVTLTATHRLWGTAAGSITWLVLVGGAVYVAGVTFWSARRY
jgi:drug/metabolite transporter (DMT)-like permease